MSNLCDCLYERLRDYQRPTSWPEKTLDSKKNSFKHLKKNKLSSILLDLRFRNTNKKY